MFRLFGLIGFLLLAAGAQAQLIRAEPKLQPRSTGTEKAAPARHASPGRVFPVTLAPPTPEEVAAKLAPPGKPGAPLQVGFGRDVAELHDAASLRRSLAWDTLAGSRVAAVSVTSPDAVALRVAIDVAAIPSDATLRFYGGAADPVFEVTGKDILDRIARNVASGDH